MRGRRVRAALLVVVLTVGFMCTSAAETPGIRCGGQLDGFTHHTVSVNRVQLHYVIGGHGPAVLLLHGFPETWWTWRRVMPPLAEAHTVVAVDLRGVGGSSTGDDYDADTLAADLHGLIEALGITAVAIVGHDTGGWTAYAYARQYRSAVTHLVLSGALIPGFGLDRLLDFRAPGRGLPHLAFFMQPEIPELLIGGREQRYFDRFINSPVMRRSGAVGCYAASYARPGRLKAALGQYRALYTDAENNRRGAGAPLMMPTLAISGAGAETQLSVESLSQVAVNVRATDIAGAGHYVQEERPAEFFGALQAFLR